MQEARCCMGACVKSLPHGQSVCIDAGILHTPNSSSAGSMCWCTWNTCARAHNRILAHTTHVPHVPQTQCRRNCFRLTSQRRGASQSSSHTRFDCLPTCHRITATTHNHRLTVPAPAAPRALACWARFALQDRDRLLTQSQVLLDMHEPTLANHKCCVLCDSLQVLHN